MTHNALFQSNKCMCPKGMQKQVCLSQKKWPFPCYKFLKLTIYFNVLKTFLKNYFPSRENYIMRKELSQISANNT